MRELFLRWNLALFERANYVTENGLHPRCNYACRRCGNLLTGGEVSPFSVTLCRTTAAISACDVFS